MRSISPRKHGMTIGQSLKRWNQKSGHRDILKPRIQETKKPTAKKPATKKPTNQESENHDTIQVRESELFPKLTF